MNPVPASRWLAAGTLALAALTASVRAADTPAPSPRPERTERVEKSDKSERRRERDSSGSSSRSATPATKSSSGGSAAAATVAPTGSFESFSLIAERNIFNPNRIGRTRANPDAPAPRTDQIALVGTVERGSSLVAVFDGSDPVWRKSLAVGESIGDFKVVRITSAGADLERDGKPVSLLVSHALRRPEGGDWTVAKPPADIPPAGGLIGPRPGDTSAAPPEIPSNASEVLKRLMKQREQQLKK